MQLTPLRGERRAVRRSPGSSLSLFAGLTLTLAAAAFAGCNGTIGDPNGCADCGPTGVNASATGLATSRFPRLSHLQWENTVRDLFYLPSTTGLTASFTGDPLGGIFDNNEASLQVTPGLWADYQLAAEDLAASVTGDAQRLAKLLPAGAPADGDPRASAFISRFGERAYRRPLTDDEASSYLAIFKKATGIFDTGSDFAKGARLVIQAMLQSPRFLYRIEDSRDVKDGLIPLDGHEIATKLSYMLWNTMPDDALFDAAESGALDTPEGILKEADRLLADDRAKAMVAAFHRQLFQYDAYDDLSKDATAFPNFSPSLGADMKREAELFVDDVIFTGNGGIREILTQPTTFVNDKLAPFYGLSGSFNGSFVKVDLDPAQRSGFLTRLGFLASNATKLEQHSIHRGVFINRRILCAKLPNPPDNIPPLPPAQASQTNRERVAGHTGKGTCGENCHGVLINPAGFAFEHYDAVGHFQTDEHGKTVNSADSYPLDGAQVSYDDAIGFDKLIAESDQAHDCYAQHWLEYGYGRATQEADAATITDLAKQSRKGAKALILALTQTKAFRTRVPVKEAP